MYDSFGNLMASAATVTEGRMYQFSTVVTLALIFGGLVHGQATPRRPAKESLDWSAKLTKAQAEIAKNPGSAFWHNQAGVACGALGDDVHAEKELRSASELDPDNPIHDYMLYAMYKKRGRLADGRDALLAALGKDPANPFGHFELGAALEKEGKWTSALGEYRRAKLLISKCGTDREYRDLKGNPFSIDHIRAVVDEAIARTAKDRRTH